VKKNTERFARSDLDLSDCEKNAPIVAARRVIAITFNKWMRHCGMARPRGSLRKKVGPTTLRKVAVSATLRLRSLRYIALGYIALRNAGNRLCLCCVMPKIHYTRFSMEVANFLLLARYVPNVAKEEYMRSV